MPNCDHGESGSLHTHTLIDVGIHMNSVVSTHVPRNIHQQISSLAVGISVKNQTLCASADIIPSNKSHVAIVKICPHKLVNAFGFFFSPASFEV